MAWNDVLFLDEMRSPVTMINPVLADHPEPGFNACLMMRFAETESNLAILESITNAVSLYGISLLRADQKAYSDLLWDNVRLHMDACELAVSVFEQFHQHEFTRFGKAFQNTRRV